MKRKIRFKSPLLNFFVTVTCLSFSSLFVWLFWNDLNSSGVRTDKDSIATISYKYNIAQRKFSDRVAWERVQQNTPLYDGDFIRTGDLAQATIHFKDGTNLDIYENSMLQLNYNTETGIQLSIDGGDIQVSASNNTEAKNVALNFSDGSSVNMEKGASLSAKSDSTSGKQNIEVKGGEALIKTEDGQKATVTSGEAVNLAKGQEIVKAAVNITMLKPEKESHILNFTNEATPILFEWQVKGEIPEGITIQTSKTRDFSTIAFEKNLKKSNSVKLSANSGILYWRVFAGNDQTTKKEGRLSIEKVPQIEALAPAELSDFRYLANNPKITFRWNGSSYADTYKLIVSNYSDLSNPILERETRDTFITLDSLQAGSYYWAVKPYYPVNNTGWGKSTKAIAFTVSKDQYLKKPELTVPADNAEITWKNNFNANFMWKSEISANYDILISYDKNFTDIAYMAKTSSPRFEKEFSPGELKDGSYWWKIVRHSESDLDRYNESDARKFTLSRYIPKDSKLIYPENGFTCEEGKFAETNFIWNLSDDWKESGISIFQIASDPEFKSIKLIKSQRDSKLTNLTLPEGEYWWRIGAMSENGKIIHPTQPRRFSIIAPLGMPVFTSPTNNQKLVAFNDSPVTLSWTGVKNADSYSLKVTDNNNKVVLEKDSIYERSIEVKLPEGRYTGRIQAISGSTENSSLRTGKAYECSFSVRKPSNIKTLAPEADSKIPGLVALRSPITFSWINGKDSPKSYVLVISRQNPDGSFTTERTLDTALRTQASINRLESGRYKWQVKAATTDGYSINSEEVYFSISDIIPLSTPILKSPGEEVILGSEFFRKNRRITFTWDAVPAASDYEFTLSKRNIDGSLTNLKTLKNTKQTSYTISDLSLLDVGRFEWTVKAVTRAKDGFIERESQTAKNSFRIDFGIPETVEAIKPERTYAE